MSEILLQNPVIEMRDARITALRDTMLVVLDRVNWSVMPGDFWVIAGPQHSGKSDLLLHAAGLMAPASGNCLLYGRDTRDIDESRLAERQRVGLVFADGKLFNQFTIAENIALPLRYHKNLSDPEIESTVNTLLELLELTSYANLTPASTAAIWRQRAALGRALALKPELLLLDNPNGALTMRHRTWLLNFLDQLWRGHEFFGRQPMTIVATTDDLHPWQHPGRKFAAVHEGAFTRFDSWGAEDFMHHQAVRDLLSFPPENSLEH